MSKNSKKRATLDHLDSQTPTKLAKNSAKQVSIAEAKKSAKVEVNLDALLLQAKERQEKEEIEYASRIKADKLKAEMFLRTLVSKNKGSAGLYTQRVSSKLTSVGSNKPYSYLEYHEEFQKKYAKECKEVENKKLMEIKQEEEKRYNEWKKSRECKPKKVNPRPSYESLITYPISTSTKTDDLADIKRALEAQVQIELSSKAEEEARKLRDYRRNNFFIY